MKKNVIERLEELKSSSSYDTAKGRAFIDLIIYKLENKLPIDYYPEKEKLKNRIVKIAKDFENRSKYEPKININIKNKKSGNAEPEKEKDKETKKPVKKTEKKTKEDKKDGN
jgi:hypothetical protein